MRTLIILGAVAASLASNRAQASIESCAHSLLQGSLYAELAVTPGQARQLQWIRNESSQRGALLQAQLDSVQAQIDQLGVEGDYAGQMPVLQAQRSSLLARLAGVQSIALSRVAGLLMPWQRDRCAADAIVLAAPPVLVVPAPPVYRRRVVVHGGPVFAPAPVIVHHPRVAHPVAVPAPRVVVTGPVPRGPVAVRVHRRHH